MSITPCGRFLLLLQHSSPVSLVATICTHACVRLPACAPASPGCWGCTSCARPSCRQPGLHLADPNPSRSYLPFISVGGTCPSGVPCLPRRAGLNLADLNPLPSTVSLLARCLPPCGDCSFERHGCLPYLKPVRWPGLGLPDWPTEWPWESHFERAALPPTPHL